jgi:hypothetical protein
MTAKARLMAGPKVSQGELRAAPALAEQATTIEPENRAYWQKLADLCRRTGDDGRANAITLMYLRPVAPPASQ